MKVKKIGLGVARPKFYFVDPLLESAESPLNVVCDLPRQVSPVHNNFLCEATSNCMGTVLNDTFYNREISQITLPEKKSLKLIKF